MVIQEGGNVPLWVTPQGDIAMNFGEYGEPQLKDKTKAELLGNIKSAGVDIYLVKGNRVVELQDIDRKKYISVTKIIRKERVKVWMGKTKILMQTLFEKVFM